VLIQGSHLSHQANQSDKGVRWTWVVSLIPESPLIKAGHTTTEPPQASFKRALGVPICPGDDPDRNRGGTDPDSHAGGLTELTGGVTGHDPRAVLQFAAGPGRRVLRAGRPLQVTDTGSALSPGPPPSRHTITSSSSSSSPPPPSSSSSPPSSSSSSAGAAGRSGCGDCAASTPGRGSGSWTSSPATYSSSTACQTRGSSTHRYRSGQGRRRPHRDDRDDRR
jgi:hypothetical protein